ncbi:MAG TPA: cytochrome c oxidase subunit 4 [Acidimicrobiales bacterium]|nr:cytochrome c oxidase subunit 4 [Acidimicrobiales bacterium]
MREASGARVQSRIFMGIGTFLVLAAIVYGVTAQERAGTTMLALAAAMAAMVGVYLGLHARHDPGRGEEEEPDEAAEGKPAQSEAYLPHASVWPFAMGMGMVVMANGLVLGGWALVPGALLTTFATVGYARQSRHRD